MASRQPLGRWIAGARVVLAAAGVLVFLLPRLTPFAPNLAGWSPSHQHVYAGGVPVDHDHPYDEPVVVYHPCSTHVDGVVWTVEESETGEVDEPNSTVGFQFEQSGLGGEFLPATVALVPQTPDALEASEPTPKQAPISVSIAPITPPPRA